MRIVWTFFAGAAFALLAISVGTPLFGGLGLLGWLSRGPMWTVLDGRSAFAARDEGGHLSVRGLNINFRVVAAPVAGEPRPRRLLLRLEGYGAVAGDGRQSGRVRVDAWPLDSAASLQALPLYTVIAAGSHAQVADDGVLMVEQAGRKAGYALASGVWLFDADAPLASFLVENDQRRFIALAAADDDLPAAVAVLTYASPLGPVRRAMLMAGDPIRAKVLRSSVPLVRPAARHEENGRRFIDLQLPAGLVRIPLRGDDLDLAAAALPAGLSLKPLLPWGRAL